ncbi:MAG: hypothetical protein MUF71_00340 [Candidatus Kapabacteria bacterium]|jgi:putative membrane protein|nr:hypothetical protein [Candidatus Kapabacteria bacterium]
MFSNIAEVFRAFIRFHTTDAIKILLKRVVLFGLYTGVLVFVLQNYFPVSLKIDTILLSLLGTLLSLLLVFRTNTAYDRFWEGRKAWGSLINNSRSFAMIVHGILERDDAENRTFFAKYIAAYAHALKGHLRDKVHYEELEGLDPALLERLPSVMHIPNIIGAELFARVEMLRKQKLIADPHLRSVKPHHDALIDIAGVCERIKRTPIPFSYGFYIKLFITVYVCLLPFLLLDKYGYYTIPAIMFAAYALMGIEMIAREIEEPFGLDANDLPLDSMARTIYLNVHEILGVHINEDPVQEF